jgi:hypothetical protein
MFAEALIKEFPDRQFILDNSSLDIRSCSGKALRPDILIHGLDRSIIIEYDEHAHKKYDVECEVIRMIHLVMSQGGTFTFILRYNPDAEGGDANIPLEQRQQRFFAEFRDCLECDLQSLHENLMSVRFSYYPENRQRRIEEVLKDFKGNYFEESDTQFVRLDVPNTLVQIPGEIENNRELWYLLCQRKYSQKGRRPMMKAFKRLHHRGKGSEKNYLTITMKKYSKTPGITPFCSISNYTGRPGSIHLDVDRVVENRVRRRPFIPQLVYSTTSLRREEQSGCYARGLWIWGDPQPVRPQTGEARGHEVERV